MLSNFHENIGGDFLTCLQKHLEGIDTIFGSFWMTTITNIIPSFLDILSLEALFPE